MQHKKGFLALAIVLIIGLVIGFRTLERRETPEEGNRIRNGQFSEVNGSMPEDWETGMWVTSPGTTFFEVVTLEDGTKAALIENAGSNDARFEQTVSVSPNTFYRFSAKVRAEGCGDGLGANLSFLGTYGTSSDLHDTDGKFKEITLYVQTGADQKEATAAIRLGGYGSENTGKAWFKDVSLEAVSEVPVGATALYIGQSETGGDAETEPGQVPVIPVLLLVSALWAIVSLLLIRGGIRLNPKAERITLVLVLLAAFWIRVILSVHISGYGVDIGCFSAWAAKMASGGPAAFYEPDYFCDYPPAYMLVLGAVGHLVNVLGIGYSGMGIQIVLKLIPELCDLALALLLYVLIRRKWPKAALILSAVFAFNPAYIITGSCWGQIDSVAALLIVLFLSMARDGRWERAIPVFALTVLTKPQAGLLAPLGIFALIMEFRRKENVRRIWIGLAAAVAVTLVIVLPFSLKQESPLWLVDKYLSTLGSYDYATLSTGNLMFLLGGNWVENTRPLLGQVTYGQVGMTLMFLSMAAGIGFYLKKGRQYLYTSAAMTLQLVFVLGTKMHERYILAGLVLLLLAYVETEDVRLLLSFLLATAVTAVNVGIVLAYDYLIAPNMGIGYVISVMQLLSAALTVSAAVALLRGREPLRLPERAPVSGAPEAEPESARTEFLRDQLRRGLGGIVPLQRRDLLFMLAVTLVYLCVAFYDLGVTKAPQTGYISSAANETVTIDLGDSVRGQTYHIYYYGGISDTQFTVCTADSPDEMSSEERVVAYFDRGECFKWQAVRRPTLDENGRATGASGDMLTFSGRYIELVFDGAGSSLWEVAAVDENGKVLPAVGAAVTGAREGRAADPNTLIDEPDTVPLKPTYQNSMYFDEIYHARTGYEHAHSLSTYETTHPPLGKVFMSLCIRAMGMTPFAWRFAGALTGVLMLPAIYLLALQILGSARWAGLAECLLALDCMHFTQTRIATIDSFPVLFMMLMFLFMVRWMRRDFWRTPMPKLLAELALSGLFMGMAIASKWIGCYGAIGLAVLFFSRVLALYSQYRFAQRHPAEEGANLAHEFPRRMITTLLWCVVFFVLVPVVIYILSYIPYLSAYGKVRLDGTMMKRIWDAQVLMYDYHANLVAEHYFSSPWYEWPLIIKPMWYYSAAFPAAGMASSILAFGNPAIWWGCLAGMIFILLYSFVRNLLPALRVRPIRIDPLDRMMPVVVIGFLSAYLPWVLVSRLTFIYHYFASVPFIILALCMTLCYAERRWPGPVRILRIVYVVIALMLFIGFYPLASGHEVPRAWCDAMNWFGNWMWY